MKKRIRSVIKILGIFVLVPMLSWSYASNAESAEIYPGINAPWTESKPFNYKGTITIGDVSDITGPAGKTCYPISIALADWFKYINEYMGGVEGYKVVVDTVDTKFDPQNEINTINRFVDEGKIIMYSPIIYVVPAAIELANRRKVPVLSSSGPVSASFRTSETGAKSDNYFFQMSPVVASRMDILVKFFMEDWKKKGKTGKPVFGTINLENQTGHEAATAARIYVEKHGGKFGVHTFHPSSITDARSQVSTLKRAEVDYIVGGPDTDQPMTVFALELDRQKTAAWAPTFGGHTDFGTAYLDTKNKAFEGHYTYQYMLDWTDTDAPIIKFIHEINKKWHPEVTRRPFTYNLGIQAGIVITEVLRKGIKQYGDPKNLDGAKLRAILETFDKYDPLGISGPITYNRYDHQGVNSLRIAQCKDKQLVPATGWILADPLTDEQRDGKYWLKD